MLQLCIFSVLAQFVHGIHPTNIVIYTVVHIEIVHCVVVDDLCINGNNNGVGDAVYTIFKDVVFDMIR
jgi:hypothetical protein